MENLICSWLICITFTDGQFINVKFAGSFTDAQERCIAYLEQYSQIDNDINIQVEFIDLLQISVISSFKFFGNEREN